ncbi:uncharacterized protein LOC111355275 [Spodoptera litura]|uniref:Uncharacterized protein LOC111355275 n=1 Tax=Spodoptera litura TaxID=69820 RepID=A0A9J7IVJ5_SPOLT|nr:uncharacterized protein LOC111355275 [Spodoptera litura]
MYKCVQVCVLCYVCFVVFILIDLGKANDSVHHRHKRYLSFKNMSHFFLRFNFKVNMVPWTQIFAQALGFRMNWDTPPDTFHPYRNHFIHRRTVYSHTEKLLDKNGLNGFHCVRRAICEMEMIAEPRKTYHKLLKMVFRQQSSDTDRWHNRTTEDCKLSQLSCPFSFLDVSLFTDTV